MRRPNLHVIRELAARKIFKQFAAKHHLVYFGHVDPRDDEYELVRGVTVSTTHVDSHYTVGTIEGRDLLLVQRSNTLVFPGKKPVHYTWLIAQIDLKRTDLPHMFIDVHQHDEVFYASLFARLPQFQDLTNLFRERDPVLAKRGKVFGFPQYYAEIEASLPEFITSTMVKEFKQFDYELHGDKLYVYASKTRPASPILLDMVRVGVWIADEIDQLTF